MELSIDGMICDLGNRRHRRTWHDAARTETIDDAREGRSLKIGSGHARNRPILQFAEDPDSALLFQRGAAPRRTHRRGCRVDRRSVRLLAVKGAYYEIEIRSGGGWVGRTGRTKQVPDELGIDWSGKPDPTAIYQSWTDDSPVRFFPVHHDEYEQAEQPSDLLPCGTASRRGGLPPLPARRHARRDNLPQAGYRVKSRFFESELFQSLYMSGAYASRDTAAAVNRMGFLARRLAPATATANESDASRLTPRPWPTPWATSSTRPHPRPSMPTERPSADSTTTATASRRSTTKDLLHAPVGNHRRIRILPQIHHHPPNPLPDALRFDTIYLGPGAESRFQLANRYEDLRNPLTNNSHTG